MPHWWAVVTEMVLWLDGNLIETESSKHWSERRP